jgi:hypothetical protein
MSAAAARLARLNSQQQARPPPPATAGQPTNWGRWAWLSWPRVCSALLPPIQAINVSVTSRGLDYDVTLSLYVVVVMFVIFYIISNVDASKQTQINPSAMLPWGGRGGVSYVKMEIKLKGGTKNITMLGSIYQ